MNDEYHIDCLYFNANIKLLTTHASGSAIMVGYPLRINTAERLHTAALRQTEYYI